VARLEAEQGLRAVALASGWTGALFATAIVFAFVGYVHTGEQISADFSARQTDQHTP
jgi:hypothetical protein